MHDLYHSGRGTIEPNHPDYELALEAERDMQLLGFAFDQLSQFTFSATYRGLLKRLVHDSLLPQSDRENSHGRDAAFEIHVAGVCAAAQLDPVMFEEPDVTCSFDGIKYSLAAKRLKNIKQLRRRIRKAGEQIDRSGSTGIIMLDLGPAFNPDNHRIRRMPEAVFCSEYATNFNETWSELQPDVQKIISRHRVLGIIVHDYHVRQQDKEWQLAGMTYRVTCEARPRVDQRLFNTLAMLYAYGLPNQSDASTRALFLP